MKHLTTLFTLLLSCTMLAQGPVEFPWNPDSDGDDFIGVNDLMALLGEFDSVFSEEALYLSEDSLTAMYDAGSMNYIECQSTCGDLPGNWKIPKLKDVVIPNINTWIELSASDAQSGHLYGHYMHENGDAYISTLGDSRGCFCVTKERPKMEYEICTAYSGQGLAQGLLELKMCVNPKVAEGWQLQGEAQVNESNRWWQTLWRWAE